MYYTLAFYFKHFLKVVFFGQMSQHHDMTGSQKTTRKRPIVCVTLDSDIVDFLKTHAKQKRSGGVSGVVTDALLSYPPFVDFCRHHDYDLPLVAETPAQPYDCDKKRT